MGPSFRASDRVLVRMPSWLGDCVAAEPALRRLVEATDDGERLSIAMPRALSAPFRDTFPRARFILQEDRGGEHYSDWRGHDVAVLFTGSFRSAWTAFRAGIPRRVGWSRDGRGWLLTDRARPTLERGGPALGSGVVGGGRRFLPRPFVTSCSELLGLVGLMVDDPKPRLVPDPGVLERVRERLGKLGLAAGEPFLLANVGGRAGSAKSYPAERWARALDLIGAWAQLPVVLVYGPGEEQSATEVSERASSLPRLFGPPAADLRELVGLAAECAVVLTADGGPRHIAAALSRPIVCVFGPTDPRHTADGLERTRTLANATECAPCHHERCPLEGHQYKRCMLGVEPERIAQATEELFRAHAGRR